MLHKALELMVNTVVLYCRSHAAMRKSIYRLTQNYSVLRPELLESFQEDLHNCSEAAKTEKRYQISDFFTVFVLFRFITETKVQILIYIDELNLFTHMQASTCVYCFRVLVLYFLVLDIHL